MRKATSWNTQVLSINMKFFGHPCRTKAMTTDTMPKAGLFNFAYLLLLAPSLPPLKPKAHARAPMMDLGVGSGSLDQFILNKSLLFTVPCL